MIEEKLKKRNAAVYAAMDLHEKAGKTCGLCKSGCVPTPILGLGWMHIDSGDVGGDACWAKDIWNKLFNPEEMVEMHNLIMRMTKPPQLLQTATSKLDKIRKQVQSFQSKTKKYSCAS